MASLAFTADVNWPIHAVLSSNGAGVLNEVDVDGVVSCFAAEVEPLRLVSFSFVIGQQCI